MFPKGYKVKRIVVYPYQQFSLQYHKKRTEHWSIVSGTGTITINEKEYDVSVGSNWVILPKDSIHRATAGGTEDLVFIETQIGECDEDDIIRLEDDYGRVETE